MLRVCVSYLLLCIYIYSCLESPDIQDIHGLGQITVIQMPVNYGLGLNFTLYSDAFTITLVILHRWPNIAVYLFVVTI